MSINWWYKLLRNTSNIGTIITWFSSLVCTGARTCVDLYVFVSDLRCVLDWLYGLTCMWISLSLNLLEYGIVCTRTSAPYCFKFCKIFKYISVKNLHDSVSRCVLRFEIFEKLRISKNAKVQWRLSLFWRVHTESGDVQFASIHSELTWICCFYCENDKVNLIKFLDDETVSILQSASRFILKIMTSETLRRDSAQLEE